MTWKRVRELLLESPAWRTMVSVGTTIAAGVLAGTFVYELGTPAGLAWKSYYRTASFYGLLVVALVTYFFNRAVYIHERDVSRFMDDQYCIAYMRSKLLPEAADKYREQIRNGAGGELVPSHQGTEEDSPMRVLAAPTVADKLDALSGTPPLVAGVRAFVSMIEAGPATKEDLLAKLTPQRVDLLQEGIYAFRSGSVRVFFTFADDADGGYVLILDVAEYDSGRPLKAHPRSRATVVSARDPNSNRTLNPHYNRTLNPHYNKTLNPHYNKTLNPHYNKALNPHYNKSLNPHYNKALNPHYNKALNPHYNKTLNPHYNRTLNPFYNRAFGGPFVYDTSMRRKGYFVRADNATLLSFDQHGSFGGYCHRTLENRYLCFDQNGSWQGYLIPASNGVLLRYSTDGEWTGIVVDQADGVTAH